MSRLIPIRSISVWVSAFRRRMIVGQFLRFGADAVAPFLLVWGLAIFVSRFVWPQFWPQVLWFGWLLVPLVVWVGSRAYRTGCSREDAAALLDRKMNAGGLLMTLDPMERAGDDITPWTPQLPRDPERYREALPRLAPKRFLTALSVPAAFVLIAASIPLRLFPEPAPDAPTVAQQKVAELRDQLTTLEEASVITAEEVETFRADIDRLEEQAAEGPLTGEAWEVVDTLSDRMELRLDIAEGELSQAFDSAVRLAEASGQPLPPEEKAAMTSRLAGELEKLPLDPEQLKALPKLAEVAGRMESLPAADRPAEMARLLADPELRGITLDLLKQGMTERGGMLGGIRDRLGFDGGTPGGPLAGLMPGTEPDGPSGFRNRSSSAGAVVTTFKRDANRFREVLLPPGATIPDRTTRSNPTDAEPGVTPTEPDTVADSGTPPTERPREEVVRNDPRMITASDDADTYETRVRPSDRPLVYRYRTRTER